MSSYSTTSMMQRNAMISVSENSKGTAAFSATRQLRGSPTLTTRRAQQLQLIRAPVGHSKSRVSLSIRADTVSGKTTSSGGAGSWEEPMTSTFPAPYIRNDVYSSPMTEDGNGATPSATSTIDGVLHDTAAAAPSRHAATKAGTHVVCTLGPSSRSVEMICELLAAGMSVARFNFSHGDYDYHSETLANLREACKQTGSVCAVLQDTKGPEVRTGMLKTPKVTYERGSKVTLTSDYTVVGDETTLALSYESMASSLVPGNRILMADGTLMMQVLSTDVAAGTVECEVLNTAELGERKNCNLPGVIVDLPTITPKDEQDILWGIENEVDFLAVSFVRTGNDVRNVRKFMGRKGRYIQVISKVENQQGLQNINDIIRESDGVMLARGDLGMEVPLEKMFQIQKIILRKCNEAGKPVITATQMLESMCNNPRPTRAEATDVANAVLDGSDSVMLSGETAAGKFPVEAVQIMSSICEEAEKCLDNSLIGQSLLASTMRSDTGGKGTVSVQESLASSAVATAAATGAGCIVVLAATGITARLIAKYRPGVPVIVGVVPRAGRSAMGFQDREASGHQVARQLMITRGVVPYVIPVEKYENMSKPEVATTCLNETIEFAKQCKIISSGENVVTLYNVNGEHQCTVVRVVPCP